MQNTYQDLITDIQSKNPQISIEKAIQRELKKKKKKKMNMCKIINKKNTLYF